MKARQILKTSGALIPVLAVVAALAAAFPTAVAAQSTGTLAGSVTADAGEIRAFRVKARDTVGRVAYTVYTVDGRYRIYNLPPGSYEVQVIEGGYAPLVKTVEVSAGRTATADLALESTGQVAAQGAGRRQ